MSMPFARAFFMTQVLALELGEYETLAQLNALQARCVSVSSLEPAEVFQALRTIAEQLRLQTDEQRRLWFQAFERQPGRPEATALLTPTTGTDEAQAFDQGVV
ncbi:hypothetical protein [Deinococcus navajonensis]|uniref:Uncharacterized protein n=1 Tax=Deinococcus navajonensis TaxID=309884 RepID=A0ABV8XIM4_9DEIO